MTSQPTNESELQLYRVLQRANLLSYYDTFICQGESASFSLALISRRAECDGFTKYFTIERVYIPLLSFALGSAPTAPYLPRRVRKACVRENAHRPLLSLSLVARRRGSSSELKGRKSGGVLHLAFQQQKKPAHDKPIGFLQSNRHFSIVQYFTS